MNPWVTVSDRLPEFGWPTLIWGDGLDPEMDFPLPAWLCHDGVWLITLDLGTRSKEDDDNAAAYTMRMVGNVTHWLDWEPPTR